MRKFIFNKGEDVGWTRTQNQPFPLSTASHCYDIERQKEKDEFFETIKSGKLPPLKHNITGLDYINKN